MEALGVGAAEVVAALRHFPETLNLRILRRLILARYVAAVRTLVRAVTVALVLASDVMACEHVATVGSR